jgi:hypothetical protein
VLNDPKIENLADSIDPHGTDVLDQSAEGPELLRVAQKRDNGQDMARRAAEGRRVLAG